MADGDQSPLPTADDGVAGYVASLRSLKVWAGNPSLQVLARRSGVPRSTIADALDPGRRTLPRIEVVNALVAACGLMPSEVQRWERVWKELHQPDYARTSPAPQPARSFLPGDLADFTGRAGEIAAVLDAVNAGGTRPVVTISAIDGMAGVGKTTLAVRAAYQLSAGYPDGQFFIDLHGHTPGRDPLNPSVALHRLLFQLGLDAARIPRELEDRAALWRAETAGRKAIVVLDNAASPEQVRPLLPGGACPVLITSRRRLSGLEGANILSMRVLSPAEAVELFQRIVGPQRVAGQADAVAAAVELCGFLPLAIRLAATRLRHRPAWSLSDLVSRLRDQHLYQGAAAAFAVSFHQLDEPARAMFRFLGLHPGPDLDAPAAAALAGLPVAQAEQLLEELLDVHMIEQHTAGRYTFHDLLRAFAAEEVSRHVPERDRVQAVCRLIDHYLISAHRAGTVSYASHPTWPHLDLPESASGTAVEFADRDEALCWYGKEYPVLVGAIALAAQSRLDSQTWQLAATLACYLLQAGLWREWAAVNDMALAASERSGDKRGQALAHLWIGVLHRSEGDHPPAHDHLLQALQIFDSLDECLLAVQTLLDIALTYGEQAMFAEAVDYSRQALELARARGHRVPEGRALNSIGHYLSMLGQHDEALPYCRQALHLAREDGNLHVEAATLTSVGLIHHRLGDYPQALRHFWASLAARRAKGDYFLQSDVLTRLGDTYDAMGEPATATDLWSQALSILDDLRHRDAIGVRARLARC